MFSFRDYLYNLVTGKKKGPQAVFLRGCLLLFSLAYGLGIVILAAFYRLKPARFGAKVISVGNITLGGTGKTTFVEYLSGLLSAQGKKVAILSRGYRRDTGKPGAQGLGDEPEMLQERLPNVRVIVDKDRIKGALKAIRENSADTLVLDDGLQQWRIFKDLEIVTLDAGNPFGNGRLLPSGFLREPLGALRRADILVLTQVGSGQDTSELTQKLKRLNAQALIIESTHQPLGFNRLSGSDECLGLDVFKGKGAVIFSGIGNPQGFENCCAGLGINIVKALRFPDHHDYTQVDMVNIIQEARGRNLDIIITTHKDAVKVRRLEIQEVGIWALNIKLKIIKNEAEFNRRLFKLYSL